MAARTGLRFPLADAAEGDVLFGHPCGFIAPVSYLVKRPALSIKVSRYMARDAGGSLWNRASFASMLYQLQCAGGVLCRDARRVVKWWLNSGKPAPWLAAQALGLEHVQNESSFHRLVNRLTREDFVTIGAVEHRPF